MARLKARLIYSNSLTAENDVRYTSGFVAPDPVLLFLLPRKEILVVSMMEQGRANRECYETVEVLTPESLLLPPKKSCNIVEQIQAVAALAGIKTFEVGFDFPTGIFAKLVEKGWKVQLSQKPNCPMRRTKKPQEIEHLRMSQRAAVAGMKQAVKMIASADIGSRGTLRDAYGALTSERVREAVQIELLKRNCSGRDIIVAGGDQATDPHERGSGPLFAGEAIILDIFPRDETTGYWGDLTRTVCKGEAPTALKKIYNIVLKTQKQALKKLHPNVCGDEIHHHIMSTFEAAGFMTGESDGKHVGFIHGTGHGVGLDIHERPRIGRSGEVLCEGDVVTIEPGLYYPGVGGVRIEDTVVLKADGCEILATCSKKFILS
ncbi:MAG: peptidase M24 [Kiritimatiellaceae bacterium]|nr:peptidase M24 [Kiritimatiellaceae bacterium]